MNNLYPLAATLKNSKVTFSGKVDPGEKADVFVFEFFIIRLVRKQAFLRKSDYGHLA